MSWEYANEYPINQISDIVENKTHYILRAARAIHFMDKESRTIAHSIPLAIDHEFGYKLLEANEKACFVVVHCESNHKEDVFGDPKKTHLQSYSTQGLNWSYALSGWSIGANYGGVFLLDDVLVFTEKQEEELITVVLDVDTGQVIQEIPEHRYRHHSGNHLGVLQSLKDAVDSKIYLTVNSKGLYEIDLNEEVPKSNLVQAYRPKTIAQNEIYVYCHGFKDGKTYLFVIDKKSKEIHKALILDNKINIESMIAADDNETILFIHEDYSVSCFNVSDGQIKWTIAPNEDSEIYQVIIDEHVAYCFWAEPSTYISMHILNTGQELQKIEPLEGKFYQPFFVLDDALFVADFNKLYCFEKG